MFKDTHQKVDAILRADPIRWRLLEVVSQLDLPDCWIAAGFIRNAVWDALHGRNPRPPLGDVDVIWCEETGEPVDGGNGAGGDGRDLLVPIFRDGALAYEAPSLEETRERAIANVAEAGDRRVELEPRLAALKASLMAEHDGE